ncbi:hypothetical protein DFH09DRAFT_1418831 [Mycena vulgaris]|nr:hypothetical protein DFH09DRAFT_1418831 [Mycena vulgaris]
MYELSWALRRKPDWQRQASDPETLSTWRQRALERQKPLAAEHRMTEKMVDYVLAELTAYAKIADKETGIERGCFDAIWYSDRLISNDITRRLRIAARALENVPETDKDWHPGSNGKVLNLVNPSLYCVVYGRTHAYLPDKPRVPANLLPVVVPAFEKQPKKWAISNDFCWLPSDFAVSTDGSVKLVSPYINNLHPQAHAPLYRVIEDILAAFVPMFGRVLGEIDKDQHASLYDRRIGPVDCIWPQRATYIPSSLADLFPNMTETQIKALSSDEEKQLYDSVKSYPEACTYADAPVGALTPILLRGRTVQCVIKLVNIHLTPERPKYSGGDWLVDGDQSTLLPGMANEQIVASGIYYYDEENITVSKLAFQIPTEEPTLHHEHDWECANTIYGIDDEEDFEQYVGSMAMKAGRALAWPSMFLPSLSSFKLSDFSKPGHSKLLALFLVDPTINPIASATDVPPQQAEWVADALQESLRDEGSLVSRLPQELVDLIKETHPATVMTLPEAEAYRLELMEERRHLDEWIGVYRCED